MSASTALLVAALSTGALLVAGAVSFNRFVVQRNHVRESWANVDTELRRRHDLVPNLVEAVRGYAAHERGVLEAVAAARAASADEGAAAGEQADAEQGVVRAIRGLVAVAEDYPDLRADAHFAELQAQLAETEDRIQLARRIYNANVRDLNRRVESFPSRLVALAAGFRRADYFEIEEAVRHVPEVATRDVLGEPAA